MLNWIKKLFGRTPAVRATHQAPPRLPPSPAASEALRQRARSHITPMSPADRRRAFDATAEDAPACWWPIYTDGVDVSERAVRGMDSMAASLDPVVSGGGGNFSGGGASGDWGGSSDSSSSSSDSSSSSSSSSSD